MTLDRLNRRIHLYLAMFLMPWFLLYGVSAIPFSHRAFFEAMYKDGTPDWTSRFEREYHVPLPTERDRDREIGAQILTAVGIGGVAYHAYRSNPRTMHVHMPNFLAPKQVVYFADENKIVMQDQRFRWDRFLTAMHSRGGFQQDVFSSDAWAVMVDIVMVAILTWIVSGIYMWWHIPAVRAWGFVALGGGCISFLLLLFGM